MSILDRLPIYSEISNCRDCYKCVRTCPVKAIQIKDAHAEILPDRCIYCGTCVNECPNGVKQIRNDVDRVEMAFMSKRRVIVSLAPSYVSEFTGYEENFVRALYRLGFDAVSETAIGAALVSQALDMYIAEHGSANFISTACPSVVELIRKYFPESVKDLAPVPSPLQTHCAYLRHLYGNDITIVFVGPCIAKKVEADEHPGYPDIALTFREVEQWLEEENIQLDTIDTGIPVEFIPAKAGKAAIYPIENGQIETSKVWENRFVEQNALSVSGVSRIISSLKGTHTDDFLETLNCEGGCINGPGTSRNDSAVVRKKAVASHVMTRLSEPEIFDGDEEFAREVLNKGYGILNAKSPAPLAVKDFTYSEDDIIKALHRLGKNGPEDELNCGGCGYPTCRDMARALLAGISETEMCVTKMRKDAESKVDILLSTIPHGVVIVDNELNIADLNKRFVDIFEDYPESFLDAEGLKSFRGSPVSMFVPFAEKFREQFYLQKPAQYRFKHEGKIMRVTFFLVESKMLLGAMFEDITTPVVRREAVIEKAEEVISRSLNTVQQIASLLGENAAETEIVMNSIIEEFNVHSDSSSDHGLVEESDGTDK
ncbi:MAG: 4Fe-4S binding protein [Mogibacterium sp.]|nr:4Fe-4S binding protein [Mogibacterium sp.]